MRSNVYIYIVMVSALSCLVGCHKPQEQAIQEQATENPQVASESTCGATTLDAADADKWECVPDVGHWCTDPNGCPVKGNIAGVGTRLAFAQPLPQGTGYQFGGKKLPPSYIPSCDEESGRCSAAEASWICTLKDGCDCGAGKVKMDGECTGDTYRVGHGIPSETCNEDKCGTYCRNNQCVCGEKNFTEKNDECWCGQHIEICMKPEGCTVDGKNYAYYQTWINYRYENRSSDVECDEKQEETKPSDASQTVAQQNNHAEQASEKAKDMVVPEGYSLTNNSVLGENVLECALEDGCPCGAQICPKDFICHHDRCVTVSEEWENGPMTEAYYCDEACSCSGSRCPKNAFCRIEDGDRGWTNESSVRCESFKEVKDAQTAFEYWKKWKSGSVSDDEYKPHVIFDKKYWRDRENGDANYYLSKKDGKTINMYVVCSNAGCDCNGSPLDKHYYCIQQHVVFARGEEDDWNTCRSPYQPFTYDMRYVDVSCDIGENIVEQVCFHSKGCACGSTTIAKGDVCVDGQGRCSTLHSRPGCLCGDKTLEKGYGCYKGSLMCQSDKACKCRETDIHYGDICAEDSVICGVDSSTTGCICAGEALKEGYRCFEKKQLCDCKNSDDNDGEDEKACKCKCGKSQIAKGEACKNNKPLPLPKAEIIKNENGDSLLKCGNEMINIQNDSIRYDNGNDMDLDRPEDRAYVCTCGTGKPAPGEGYGCAFSRILIGPGSEWIRAKVLNGWMCLNMEGCKCGDSICYPDLCLGSDQCAEFNTLNPKDGRLECDGHVLPVDVVMKGYGCYASYEFVNAPGWYCSKPEGCPCGEATCEQNQMCLAPGQCGVHKLGEPEQNKLKFLQVKRVDCNDYC